MRGIISKHDSEKKAKRNRIILGLVLVSIMFLSTAGYAILSLDPGENAKPKTTGTENYNGFEFLQQNGYWILNLNNESYIFSYNPNEIFRISSEIKPLDNYRGKILYLVSGNQLAGFEIRTNLAGTASGVVENEKENCEQNTIVIKEGTENKITQNENCVYIEGKTEDLIKITDEFLFKLLKITD